MHLTHLHSRPPPRDRELETVRRTLACARTLLDEVERSIAQSSQESANRRAVAQQAAEELARLAALLLP